MPILLTGRVPTDKEDAETSATHPALKFFRDNGLSIAFFSLYLLSAIGQAVTGVRAFNADRVAHTLAPVSFGHFLRTGTFLDGIFSNWQAAMLQLGALILFGSFLRQKGATHSRKKEGEQGHREDEDAGRRSWAYRNSLSLAFAGLFLISFILHAIFGAAASNEQREMERHAPQAIAAFFHSAKFWTSTFACWQAEFIAIFAYVIFSIFLRQKNSPESKPANASDRETGESNK